MNNTHTEQQTNTTNGRNYTQNVNDRISNKLKDIIVTIGNDDINSECKLN